MDIGNSYLISKETKSIGDVPKSNLGALKATKIAL